MFDGKPSSRVVIFLCISELPITLSCTTQNTRASQCQQTVSCLALSRTLQAYPRHPARNVKFVKKPQFPPNNAMQPFSVFFPPPNGKILIRYALNVSLNFSNRHERCRYNVYGRSESQPQRVGGGKANNEESQARARSEHFFSLRQLLLLLLLAFHISGFSRSPSLRPSISL